MGSTSVFVANYRVVASIERPLLRQQIHGGGRERERERKRGNEREKETEVEKKKVCVRER